jgi:hypothetical protein
MFSFVLFAVHTGKKKDFVKKCEFTRKSVKFREFTLIHVKNREFGRTVNLTILVLICDFSL